MLPVWTAMPVRIRTAYSSENNLAVDVTIAFVGILAVGTKSGLSVFRLNTQGDFPTWAQEWSSPSADPFCLPDAIYSHPPTLERRPSSLLRFRPPQATLDRSLGLASQFLLLLLMLKSHRRKKDSYEYTPYPHGEKPKRYVILAR